MRLNHSESYIQEIKNILSAARQKVYSQINIAMIEAYWQTGKRIVQEEQGGANRAAYGEQILEELSKALSAEFGKGFSLANLRNFRQFYLTFPTEEKRYALRSELSWTHYRLIMRVDDEKARMYYMNETADQQWSSRVLERNINTLYYQRLLSTPGQTETTETPANKEIETPKDFIKDPYIFEFLNIPEPITHSEREIETALITNLQSFLLELR